MKKKDKFWKYKEIVLQDRGRVKANINVDWNHMSYAVNIVILFVLTLWFFWGINFEGNDDTGMMHSSRSGKVWMYASNMIAKVLHRMYIRFPQVSWYSVYSIFIIIACLSIIVYCFWMEFSNKILMLFAGIIIPFIFSIRLILAISWTANSALCGVTAIILLLSYHNREIMRLIGSFAFLFLSHLIRSASFQAILPFWGIVLLYVMLRNSSLSIKNILVGKYVFLGAVTMTCIIWTAQFDREIRKETGYSSEENAMLGSYLSTFLDSNVVPYDDNQKLYESIGWDRQLYAMVRNWYFMDERVTLNAMQKLMEAADKGVYTQYNKDLQKLDYHAAWETVMNVIKKNAYYRCVVIFIFFLMLLNILMILRQKERQKLKILQLCFICLTAVGMLLELFYLGLRARIIPRVFITAAFPALFILLFHLKNFCPKIKRAQAVVLAAVCVILSIGLCRFLKGFYLNEDVRRSNIEINSCAQDREIYCAMNPDCLFIYDNSMVNDNRFLPALVGEPVNNRLFWGGTGYKSSSYYGVIQQFGYTEFTTRNFFDDNVYLLTKTADIKATDFWQYLLSVEDHAEAEIVNRTTSGMYVYKFSSSR